MINYSLKNRVAIITGANNPWGIGATTALAFAREGAKVALVFKRIDRPFDKEKTGSNGVDRYYAANAGGMDAVIANAKDLPGYLDLTKGYDVVTGQAASYGFIPIVSTLAWGLGYFGMPHILVRFMAVKNSKMIKKSSAVAITWLIITLAAAIAIAFLGRTYLLDSGTALAEKILPDAADEREDPFLRLLPVASGSGARHCFSGSDSFMERGL